MQPIKNYNKVKIRYVDHSSLDRIEAALYACDLHDLLCVKEEIAKTPTEAIEFYKGIDDVQFSSLLRAIPFTGKAETQRLQDEEKLRQAYEKFMDQCTSYIGENFQHVTLIDIKGNSDLEKAFKASVAKYTFDEKISMILEISECVSLDEERKVVFLSSRNYHTTYAIMEQYSVINRISKNTEALSYLDFEGEYNEEDYESEHTQLCNAPLKELEDAFFQLIKQDETLIEEVTREDLIHKLHELDYAESDDMHSIEIRFEDFTLLLYMSEMERYYRIIELPTP